MKNVWKINLKFVPRQIMCKTFTSSFIRFVSINNFLFLDLHSAQKGTPSSKHYQCHFIFISYIFAHGKYF